MERLNVPFCKVCSETFVERFHQFVKPLSGFSPEEEKFNIDPELEQDIEFSLSLVPPDPNTLKITWEKDDVVISKNIESVTVSSADIEVETSATIRATVLDTISLTRAESHAVSHMYIVEWEITKGLVTGVEVQPKQYDLSVYPNPSDGDLKFTYTLSRPGSVTISVVDSNGRKMKTLVTDWQENGKYDYAFKREELNIPPAEYFLQFKFGKTIVPVKVIIR